MPPAACWLVGGLVWLAAGTLTPAVPWWLAFLVLTIAGERLELTRFLPTPPRAQRLFIAIVAIILLGAALAWWREGAGLRLFAGGLLALAAWLLRYDIARRNARQSGLTRYLALCLLSGYLWLALAGDFATQRSGAAANAGALLLFIATLATSVVRGRRQTAKEAPDAAS